MNINFLTINKLIRLIITIKLNVSIISRRIIIRKSNKLINKDLKLNVRFILINSLILLYILFIILLFLCMVWMRVWDAWYVWDVRYVSDVWEVTHEF